MMAADEPVTGQAAVSMADHLRAIYRTMPTASRVALPAVTIAGLGLLLILAPVVGILAALLWVGLVRLLLPIVQPGINARQLYIAVDRDKIERRDGAAFADVVGWGAVSWCRESDLGFTVGLRPIGVIWLPRKAFSASAIRSLRRLISEKLGRAAQLRDDQDGQ
jgi:hypothetical protein